MPRAALEQRGDRDRARDRLEAAAVAAAADRAARVDEHVADLAGDAAEAAVGPAAEDEPGADAGGERGRRSGRRRRGAAPNDLLAERADVGVVLELRRARRAAPPSRPPGGCRASRAGCRRPRARPSRRLIGAARPMPTPSRRSCVDARASQRSRARARAARSRLSIGAWSTSAGDQSSATSSPERSQTATRMCWWPKSRPTANAAPGTSESRTGGRPVLPRAAPRAPRAPRRRRPRRAPRRASRRSRARGPVQRARSVRLDAGMAVERLDDAQAVHLAQAERGRIGGHAFARNIAASTARTGANGSFAVGGANRPLQPPGAATSAGAEVRRRLSARWTAARSAA